MPTLAINTRALTRLRAECKPATYGELAKRIGIHEGTLSKARLKKAEPGAKLIAGVLAEFGWDWFREVFQLVD